MSDVSMLDTDTAQDQFQHHSGEMADRIRGCDWGATALGPVTGWSQILKTAVDIMLASPHPVAIMWGPERVQLYNDAYIPIAAERHPHALGRPAAETWAEAFEDFLGPTLNRVSGGETVTLDRHGVPLRSANGELEERFFTGSFLPIRDEAGAVAGVFHPLTEVTDQVRADAERRLGEQRFYRVLDGMGEAFGLLAPDFTILEQNVEALRLDGRPRDQIIGRSHWDVYPGSEHSEVGKLLKHAMAHRVPVSMEHQYAWDEQRALWLEMRAYPVEDGTLAVFWRDVTDRRDAQEQLRETSRRLDAILNNTREAVFLMDHRQHCVYANAAAEQLTGYSMAEMQGRPLHDVVHHKKPDGSHYPIDECPIDRAFPERAQMSGEELFVHKDGSFYPVGFTASPVLNDEGQPVGTVIEARNIAEKQAREAALKELHENLERRVQEELSARLETETLYRAHFEHAPEALFVISVEEDESFVVEQINPAHEAGVGFKRDEVIGKRVDEILPPEGAAQVLQSYRRVVETGETHQFREVFDLGRGPQHWDSSLVPVRDASGRISRIVGSSRDVTRQVLAEEALRQSQKMEAMGSLTGGVAHDFNNLLTPIIGSLDMLQRTANNSEREQRLIAGALASAEKAKTLVQRLLAFARRQPLQPVAVDVAKLVRGMAELVSSTSGPQIKVAVDAPDDLPPAKGDPNQLEMALLNLAVNARDAMPEGGTLRVSASAEQVGEGHPAGLPPGTYVRLSVADTGAGMDEATLVRAVEPFFSTKGLGKGTGLGLSMVHGLAAQLGGALTIQSQRGLGTNVELWLPESHDKPEQLQSGTEAATARRTRGTALLVDDEQLVRSSIADMLSELGYEVTEAASGEEALLLMAKGLKPDLVITDHLMPGMSGTELAREIRGNDRTAPLLVISGYADAAGIDPDLPRLSKPFRQAELAAKLAELTETGTRR